MNTEATYDLIERYLNNTLNAEEKSAVEVRLKNDVRFREEVAAHKAANEVIVDSALLEIKKELKKIHAENSAKPKSNYRKFYYGLGALLLGIVLTTVLFLQQDNKTDKLVATTDQKVLNNNSVPSKSDEIKNEPIKEQNIFQKNKNKYVQRNAKITQEKTTPESSAKSNSEPKVNPEERKEKLNEQNNILEKGLRNKTNTNEDSKDNEKPLKLTDDTNQAVLPCDATSINPDFSTVSSCEGQKNGAILFNDQALRGTPPYKFSIDGGNTFYPYNQFNNQSAGNYLLVVMDQQNCKSQAVEAQIEKENCNYVIAPQQQKFWDVPLTKFEGEKVVLKIMNARTGAIVYQANIAATNSYTWQGTDQNNIPLTMGNYVYELSSGKSGLILTGQITIVQ